MRFSDFRKFKDEPRAPEERKPAAAAPAPAPAREPDKPPARPLPAFRQPDLPRAPEPAAPPDIPVPAQRQPDLPRAPEPAAPPAAATPRSRREARAAARATAAPFEELDARARETYTLILDQATSLLKGVDQPYTEKYESVLAACRVVIETLRTNGALLNYTSFSTADDYLRAHTANTAIMALAMGLEYGLDGAELNLLGFCAMAHDIGMTEYSSLYNRADRLGESEYAEMSLHAEAGAAKLDRIVDLDYRIKERAKHIVLQSHERADGTGYPDRLSDEEIDPLAMIINMADAYEAITHPRAWRDAVNPPDAVKELVEKEGRGFNARAVKALISAVSIYPPGSLVALSSGEIARVLMVTRGFLTKPLVEILLDQNYEQVSRRLLDLFEHPLGGIERPVSLREIAGRNPKFASSLEMSQWWVDW